MRIHTGITAPSPSQNPAPHHRSHSPPRGWGMAQQGRGYLRHSDRSGTLARNDCTGSGGKGIEGGAEGRLCEMKRALDGINSRLHGTEEKIRKLKK